MKHQDYSAGVIIVFLVGLALGIRLAIVAASAVPLNDGGLFYTFISDLLDNNLRLPAFSSYNAASIPLAYPPLAFYVIAALHLALHIPVLQLLQYAPAALSVASIPAFYFLAADLLNSRVQAALATLVFSLLPRTLDWLIMGGGITRSLGLLFALLVMRQVVQLFCTRSRAAILPAIIFGSLLVYSHPEASAQTAVTAAFVYAWSDRSRVGLRNAAIVAGGILAVTAPWWAVVLARHGLDPFLAAAAAAREDSYNSLVGLLALFRFDFTDEPFLRIFGVLGLLGLFIKVSRREFFLPAWFVLMHTFEPRGGTLYMMIPLAMAAGFCLDTLVLPRLRSSAPTHSEPASTPKVMGATWLGELLQGRGVRLFLGFLTLYGCMGVYAVGSRIHREFTLTVDDLKAFEWVQRNTPFASRFALVTQGLPLRDASSEWFPALTDRRSVATLFGFEWVRSVDFGSQVEKNRSLQACAAQDAKCLDSWAKEKGETFEYVYMRHAGTDKRTALDESLTRSADYQLVYSSEGLTIYQRK